MAAAATGDSGSDEAWAGARAAGDGSQGLDNRARAEAMEVSGNGQITWTAGGIDWARGMDAGGRVGLADGSDGANGADSTGSSTRGTGTGGDLSVVTGTCCGLAGMGNCRLLAAGDGSRA